MASEAGLKAEVLKLPGLGLDIDTPQDLIELNERLAIGETASHTQAFVMENGLGERLRLAKGFRVNNVERILEHAALGQGLSDEDGRQLIHVTDLDRLLPIATKVRDIAHPTAISYSRKVFVPLTHLCRDVCHYCTFAQVPRKLEAAYLTPEQVLDIAEKGRKQAVKRFCSRWVTNPRPDTRLRETVWQNWGTRRRSIIFEQWPNSCLRNRSFPSSQSWINDPRRDGGAPKSLYFDGDHARISLRSTHREGDASLRIAG